MAKTPSQKQSTNQGKRLNARQIESSVNQIRTGLSNLEGHITYMTNQANAGTPGGKTPAKGQRTPRARAAGAGGGNTGE